MDAGTSAAVCVQHKMCLARTGSAGVPTRHLDPNEDVGKKRTQVASSCALDPKRVCYGEVSRMGGVLHDS